MALFVISYDLVKRKDYPELWAALGKAGAHRPLLSLWLLRSNSTPQQISDWLTKYVDDDDRLFVAAVDGTPWYKNALAGTNKWLGVS